MDPLSVITSVAGIATAAGEVIKILGPYKTAREDAPKIAAEVSSEALATQTIITGLEQLVSNFSTPSVRYASLIQVDQLTAVLFDGVKIFSELLAALQTLPPLEPSSPGGSLWTPIQWVRKKSSLAAILHRLQAFRSSIVCILSILQSDSQARAEEGQQRRMMGMENTVDAMSRRRATIQSTRDMDTLNRKSTSSWRSSLFEFDFEHDLKLSRAYRHAKRDTMDFSVRSSVARTHAWSSLSGISLSDISHISVLALPLYVEDISNPQHYKFGRDIIQLTLLLAPKILTRSIYHDCIEVQLQLSQFEWFAQFQHQLSEDESPLSNLISIFSLGTPLLMLFDQLDNSYHERWKELMASSPSDEVSKAAITEFVEACIQCSHIPPSHYVTDTDILLDDTTNHVKVISLVRLLLSRLTKASVIQAIVFESAPNIFAMEPNPAGLAVDAFLCDERLYLQHLESLFENAKKIRSSRILPTDTFDPLFAPVGPLVNVQRQFLIEAEMLVSKPYAQQTWQKAFQEWAVDSSPYYAALVTGEAESKSMVRAAFSSSNVKDFERRGLLGEVLAALGLPTQRLDKYDGFLEELTQYGLHDPDHIKSAKTSLKMVKEAVNDSNIARELNRAKAALSKDQDYETNKVIWGLDPALFVPEGDFASSRIAPEESKKRTSSKYKKSPYQLNKFVKPYFYDDFDPSKQDTYRRSCVIDNEVAEIDVIDTTGQEEYSYFATINQSGREVAGFMLVYSVTSRQGFEGITTYYDQILKQKDKDYFPTVIVGIECLQESLREVSTQEGRSLAKRLGCIFVEADAESSVKVDAAFFDLVREVRQYRRDMIGC
ncbi:hypothetical protein LB505_012436 [Fusarium chuoi]|nr:hypothetical protein LB505_012436 [Fusarium chuoi]